VNMRTITLLTIITQCASLFVQAFAAIAGSISPGLIGHTFYSVTQYVVYIPAQIIFVWFLYELYRRQDEE
jgi:hypothetical protein